MKPLLCLWCALTIASVNLHAASAILTANADTTIFDVNQVRNAGPSDATMVVGRVANSGGTAKCRALLRFNLSSIPVGSSVTSATLTVTVTKNHFGSVDVHALHRLTDAWSEVGATWDGSGFGPWTGGNFDDTADSTVGIGSGSVTFPSGPAMLATVRGWLTNAASNNGWILMSEDEDTVGNARRLSSREAFSDQPTLTVQYTAPANAAPVATNDTYTTAEDNALTISAPGVLTNDSDANADPITAVLVSNPTHGTLNLNTNGAFVYMPSLNYTGLDTFTYRASDGALTSSVATVTITITPVSDAPVASNDTYTTARDMALTNSAPGVLVNDSDPDGDVLSTVLVTGPAHGTLNLNTNGAFVYTPSLNYTGLDTFTYRASDGALTSSVATVTITIAPVNRAPVATNDTYTTAVNTALTNTVPGVLANDSDPDGDVLSTVLVTGPAHGTLNLNTNGAFVYTPSLNYTGLDTFTYRASDRALTSSVATVTITITPPPPSPLVTGPRLQTNQFVFNFVGEAGHSYTVEYNANLNTSNWTTHLVFPAPAQKTNFTVLDALGTNRFFRVRAD